MNIKKLSSFIILFLIILTNIPSSVSAAVDGYAWLLTDIIELNKDADIAEYNRVNADLYKLKVSCSDRSYTFSLNYLGNDLNQGINERTFKKGDSASSSVTFGEIPKMLEQGQTIGITLNLKMISDTTYDKAYEFLETQGAAFFDKSGAQPDIPSSDAVYFTEKENKKKGTSIGTKADSLNTVSTKLYATAPVGKTEGQKISICLSATAAITSGTKYIYEWLPSDSLKNNETTIKDRIITLKEVNGKISVKNNSKGDSEYVSVDNGFSVSRGDYVKTVEDSKCILSFDDDSLINLNEKSEILIRDTIEDNTKIKLINGKAWAYIKTYSNNSNFKLEMGNAILSVNGAIFAVEESDIGSVVWLFSKTASFSSTVTGEFADLEYGEKAVFNKNGELTITNFNINEVAEKWGVPISSIVDDNGYSWVYIFIYVICGILLITLTIVFVSTRIKKRNRIKRISKFIPGNEQCIFCGRKLDYDAMFCSGCGAAVKKQKPETNE